MNIKNKISIHDNYTNRPKISLELRAMPLIITLDSNENGIN